MIDTHTEENKLLKRAGEYKGTPKLAEALIKDCVADGFSDEDAKAIVGVVMGRLNKSETGAKGNALGKKHLPADRYAAIKARINSLRR